MTLDSLRLVRNILLRSFVVGVVFTILLAVITFGAWDTWIGLITRMADTTEATIVPVLLNFFADIRFFLMFILLTPALAIHWTIQAKVAEKEQANAQSTPQT